MTPNNCSPQVDLRDFTRESRSGRVDQMLRGLPPGGSAAFIDDADPQALLLRLGRHLPGQFSWDVSEVEAGVWFARLANAPAARSEGRCCGACGES